jgi:hypothetical protein
LGKRRPAVKERKPAAKGARARRPRKSSPAPVTREDDPIAYGALSLHDLFQQQVRTMLDRTDLDEEQKQGVLIAASCPCCGAGGFSFTAKLKPRR